MRRDDGLVDDTTLGQGGGWIAIDGAAATARRIPWALDSESKEEYNSYYK